MSNGHAPFVTDMGRQLEVRGNDGSFLLERYAVWTWDAGKGKHQVAEVSNDLAGLQKTYGVPDERVFLMGPDTATRTPRN